MIRTTIPSPPGFDELSKAEQIEYLQALWDRIAERPEEVPVLQSHLDLAEQRLRQHQEDPTRARSAYEALEELREKKRRG